MPTDVVMPQMGESIAEGTIVRWIKKVGDAVERDEPLFEISTDKVDAEIPSPIAGVVTEIRAKEGETVPVNSVVAVIGPSEGATSSTRTSPGALPPMKRERASLLREPRLTSAGSRLQRPKTSQATRRPVSLLHPTRSRKEFGGARLRLSGRLRRNTTSISRTFRAPESRVASRRTTFSGLSAGPANWQRLHQPQLAGPGPSRPHALNGSTREAPHRQRRGKLHRERRMARG
jgi:pyruvate/2-oxoglutarate dehydrogenase complex dihydrolipoamide acyltransferase (E2) component